MHNEQPKPTYSGALTQELAHLTARLVAGPLTAAVSGVVRVGEEKMAFLEAASQIDALPEGLRDEAKKALATVSSDMLAMVVLRDAVNLGSLDDIRKAQDRVRGMLAFTKDDTEHKMAPWELHNLPALSMALEHLASMVRRICEVPLAESVVAIAESTGKMDDEMLAEAREERDKVIAANREWFAETQASADEEAVLTLFREVGLAREADESTDA